MLLAPHKPEILIFIYIFLRLQRNLEAGCSDEDGFFYSPDLSGSCGKLYFCVTKLKKKKKITFSNQYARNIYKINYLKKKKILIGK